MAIVLGMLFGFDGIALAGRPLSTDDAGTVAPGDIEAEVGAEYLKWLTDDKEYFVATALTIGVIWDRLDCGIEVPYLWLRPDEGNNEDGFGDLDAKLKLRFLDETDSFPALAVTIGVKTETGDSAKGLGTGKIDVPVNLIATKGFDRFTLHANAGYNAVGDPAEEQEYDLVNLSLAGEFAATERFAIVGEVAGEIYTKDVDEDNPCELLVGATYKLSFGTVLDAGVAAGLTDGAPDSKITAGLTHEF